MAATADGYGFGFNGQEQDDEVYGKWNLNTAEFWAYDTRFHPTPGSAVEDQGTSDHPQKISRFFPLRRNLNFATGP